MCVRFLRYTTDDRYTKWHIKGVSDRKMYIAGILKVLKVYQRYVFEGTVYQRYVKDVSDGVSKVYQKHIHGQ